MKDIVGIVDKIKLKEDFIEFLELLQEDYAENKSNWENDSLDSFLEAMGRWTESFENYYEHTHQKVPESIPWKLFADMLMGAKVYE